MVHLLVELQTDIHNYIIYPIIDKVVPLNGNKLSNDTSVFFRTIDTKYIRGL